MPVEISQDELRHRLDQLDAVEQIERLKYRYFMCVDTGDFDAFRELCLKDVDIDIKLGIFHMKFDNVEDFIAENKKAYSKQVISSHTGHHPQIDILSDTTASGSWYLIDKAILFTDNVILNGCSLYQDLYEKAGGIWKFKRISYRRVYEMVDPLRDRPNVTASALWRLNV